jgi:hypothetical protein
MTVESDSTATPRQGAEIIAFAPRSTRPDAVPLAHVVEALRHTGQIGASKSSTGDILTPSGRLTPLGECYRRRLSRGAHSKVWRNLDRIMEDAEVDMEAAVASGDSIAADAALDAWEQAAEAVIYCPTGHRDDIRDRLRLLAHLCGASDPTGAYLSTIWESKSPLSKLFAVLDWHIYRVFSRMDEGKDHERLHARLEHICANDDEAEPVGALQ